MNIICTFHISVSWVWYRKMEQILLVYDHPKETVTAIMTLYKDTKDGLLTRR